MIGHFLKCFKSCHLFPKYSTNVYVFMFGKAQYRPQCARQQKVSWGNTLDQERSLEQTGKNFFVFSCYLWGQESVLHNHSLGKRYVISFLSSEFCSLIHFLICLYLSENTV